MNPGERYKLTRSLSFPQSQAERIEGVREREQLPSFQATVTWLIDKGLASYYNTVKPCGEAKRPINGD